MHNRINYPYTKSHIFPDATFAVSRVNVIKATKAKSLIRNYSLKRRGPTGPNTGSSTSEATKATEQTATNSIFPQ